MNKKNQLYLYYLLILALLLLAGCGSKSDSVPIVTPSAAAQENLPIGPTSYCQAAPLFIEGVGFDHPVLSTSLVEYVGAALGDLDSAGNLINIYQHPTWDDAGYLGPITRDQFGNLYVSPVPKVSLVQNPLEDQNKIYKIDTTTGEMALFIDLPGKRPLAALNPFGVIGLTYDCDTDSLYATTLAGSTAEEEVGQIYRIDMETGEVAAQLDDVDAIGVGVFNGLTGKRLYYGSARTPEIYSIALDENGDFVDDARHEFSLVSFDGGGQEKARRISFTQDSMMVITAVNFDYSLHSAISEAQVHYKLRYFPGENWGIVDVVR